MPEDFKGRAQPRPKEKVKRRSCIIWLIAGVLLGGFAVGLLWLRLDPALIRSGSGLANTGIPRPPAEKVKQPPASLLDSLEFEFPDRLRTMTVPVPREKPAQTAVHSATPPKQPQAPAAPPPAQTPAQAPPAEREAYLLQLGSYRKASDAENLKARLAFMGVETKVQKVTINNKDTFYRVRSGPYRNKRELDEIRAMLTRNNIKTIMIKWRG